MSEKIDTPIVEDESALDAELEKSISEVKAGKELQATPAGPTGATGEEGDGEIQAGPTGATGESESGADSPTGPTGESDAFRIPNKGKFESDESYEKRIELFDLVKRRKAATTPEAKKELADQISNTKAQLKNLNGSDRINNLIVEKKDEGEEDPALTADKERLKQLGGATKEDIAAIIQQERIAVETKSTLDKFVERSPELKDEDVREVFFDFVDANYVWQGKTGKELLTVLELARENMFRPSESIQERVLKGANVQEKVNAMQFPGSTGGKVDFSPDMRKSIDELKATGMSEEKAIELLSE